MINANALHRTWNAVFGTRAGTPDDLKRAIETYLVELGREQVSTGAISWFAIARQRGNALQDAAQAMEKAAFTLPVTSREHDDLLEAASAARYVLDALVEIRPQIASL